MDNQRLAVNETEQLRCENERLKGKLARPQQEISDPRDKRLSQEEYERKLRQTVTNVERRGRIDPQLENAWRDGVLAGANAPNAAANSRRPKS
jgi:regulator of replication initiation timing